MSAVLLYTGGATAARLAIGDFAIQIGDPGFKLMAALTVLHCDKLGEMFPESNGADSQRIRE
jgi:hypothetical protein